MVSLLVLQHALVPSNTEAHARSRHPVDAGGAPPNNASSRPYLKIAGALPLRFKAPPPPPDLTSRPTAGAPPQPQMPAAEVTPVSSAPITPPKEPEIKPAESSPQPTTPNVNNQPSAILPDDNRPSTRPEDFLPFFRFPSENRDVTIVVPAGTTRPPAPGQLPPSSATYQQR